MPICLNGFMFTYVLFQDSFVLTATINLHCMGDFGKYWVDRIEWQGYAARANQLQLVTKYHLAVAKRP